VCVCVCVCAHVGREGAVPTHQMASSVPTSKPDGSSAGISAVTDPSKPATQREKASKRVR
jgi:hypothetical protein